MEDITAYLGTSVSDKMPHNGKLLKAFIAASRLTQIEVARRMEITTATLYDYYKSYSLTTDVWWRASKALHYNFLAGLSSLLTEEYVTPREAELQTACERLQKENERLDMELKIYKNIKPGIN
jgi:transcriptional regulator with XRE-family HTH domain